MRLTGTFLLRKKKFQHVNKINMRFKEQHGKAKKEKHETNIIHVFHCTGRPIEYTGYI